MARKARSNRNPGCLTYPGGQVICRRTRFGGAMRKHANWAAEMPSNDVLALDLIAHRKVPPMGAHGLVVRRKAV